MKLSLNRQKSAAMNKHKVFLFAGFVLCLLSSCKVNRPDGVLSAREMEKVLYDYHLAQSVSGSLTAGERYKTPVIMDWVFEKHQVDRDDFEKSLEWYSRYPKEFAKIYKKLNARVDAEYKQLSNDISRQEHKAFGIQSGDSVSLWYLDSLVILNTSDYMKRISLNLEADTTFHAGDTIRWKSDITLVSPVDTASQKLYVAMAASVGDSIVLAVDSIVSGRGSHKLDLMLALDDTLTLSSVRFQSLFLNGQDDRSSIAVLSGIDMVRYHRH